jgi:hypothetical protein
MCFLFCLLVGVDVVRAGSTLSFTTQTVAPTSAPTNSANVLTMTTKPGTINYKCTFMQSSSRDRPDIRANPSQLGSGLKFLFKGVPVPQFAQVVDCISGKEMYVPIAHLRDCPGALAAVPCSARP